MDLTELGLGCLLHDVGKMRIPLEILNKPGRLTFDEMETMKQHPALGFEMVRGHVPPAAASVVLNHHQRYAGGGYPGRTEFGTGVTLPPLAGKQIPVFSRIATLCDVYDAATTHRVYAPAKPPVQALHEMRTMCRGMFDPVIEAAFFEIIPPFPIGQAVTLSDGTQAAVVDFNPRSPVRPKVQPLRRASGEAVPNPALEELDLAIYDDLEIVAVDDRDVRSYTASLQPRELSLI
jgi:HD-GYP domain-containing protein (c-di-GMP phosphodiesterase class II)